MERRRNNSAVACAAASAIKLLLDNSTSCFNTFLDTHDDELILGLTLPSLTRSQNVEVMRTKLYIENVVLRFNSREFHSHFRISIRTFESVLRSIGPLLQNQSTKGRPRICPRKQLLSVIWLLATPDSYRSVGDRFDMGKSSLHHCFVRVIHLLNQIAPTVIKWPRGEEADRTKMLFSAAGLNNVIGCIDGSYIPIKAPKDDPQSYICRKNFHAITLQAICTANLKFTDCFAGYPSSVHDYRIFRNSDIYKDIHENHEMYFPNNEYIIGDKAYPLRQWCITPYINRGNMTARQIHFNITLSRTRQAIERSFALLKGRFRRIKYLDMARVDLIPATILSCCVLHDICLDYDDDAVQDYINEGRHGNVENQVRNLRNIENNFEDEAGTMRRERIALSLQGMAD